MPLTIEEQNTLDYINTESDELIVQLKEAIEGDGYTRNDHKPCAAEHLALKVLSMAMVKTLAIVCENTNHPSLPLAYLQLGNMHTDMIKAFMLKDLEAKSKL